MSCNESLKRRSDQLAPLSSLNALLVLPPPEAPRRRSLWINFLSDLSFLLPAFGVALGWLLMLGQLPFVGATIFTICALLLTLRIQTALMAWRERRQLAALRRWYRQYRWARAN